MRLRPALVADQTALAAAHLACFGQAAWPADELASLLAAPGGYGLVAETSKVEPPLAGLIVCRTIVEEAEILTLAVAPAHRRAGLGRALLEAAAELAAAASAQSMYLEVAADNDPAIALYESAAFEPVGRRRSYYAKGRAEPIDALVYRRALNRSRT